MGLEPTALPTFWGQIGPECLNLTVPHQHLIFFADHRPGKWRCPASPARHARGELPRKGWPCLCSVSSHVFRERRLVVQALRRRLFQVQYRLNPERCQRTTVSGFTMTRTLSQSVQILCNSTQKLAVTFESRGRFTERWRTASCCRRGDILESQLATSLEGRDESANKQQNHAGMVPADRRLFKFGARA